MNINEKRRIDWVTGELKALPQGWAILDAGAGEQQFRSACTHLEYVSQDFCQYDGKGNSEGLHTGTWNYGRIDVVSDIARIPRPTSSFDAILCTEVLEHVTDPLAAVDEFARLLRKGGVLLLTVPFASLVHFAPHHYVTGFSKYWYLHHLRSRGFEIQVLEPNGDWFDLMLQEVSRLPDVVRDQSPIAAFLTYPAVIAVRLTVNLLHAVGLLKNSSELGCFGYHCRAVKL